MKSLAKIRRGVYPQPVYEAHFGDGTVQRMSFFSEKGKPLDAGRGRRLINALCRWSPVGLPCMTRDCIGDRYDPDTEWFDSTYTPVVRNSLAGKRLVRGFIEHDLPGQPWLRFVDPHFTPSVVESKPKRVTAKLAKDTLSDLLDWLDGEGPPDALDRARQLIAA